MFDCHVHSYISHDAISKIDELASFATARGILGFAITDHADIGVYPLPDVTDKILKSYELTEKAKLEYGGKLKIFTGIEFGENRWRQKDADEVIKKLPFDVVLSSVHAVAYEGYTNFYAQIDFSKMDKKDLCPYLKQYFLDYIENLEVADFDVATHLTCPLRYITGKFGIKVNLEEFHELIDKILKIIIERDLAFEINTSCVGSGYDELMPDESIIKKYVALGGKKVTLASDAHKSEKIGQHFDEAINVLKRNGITEAYYYEKRRPIKYKI